MECEAFSVSKMYVFLGFFLANRAPSCFSRYLLCFPLMQLCDQFTFFQTEFYDMRWNWGYAYSLVNQAPSWYVSLNICFHSSVISEDSFCTVKCFIKSFSPTNIVVDIPFFVVSVWVTLFVSQQQTDKAEKLLEVDNETCLSHFDLY